VPDVVDVVSWDLLDVAFLDRADLVRVGFGFSPSAGVS
jgi:hypothetical protein